MIDFIKSLRVRFNKRNYRELGFDLVQKEQLIGFVKANPALYDPKDKEYKSKQFQNRLLNDFGATIGKTGNIFAV